MNRHSTGLEYRKETQVTKSDAFFYRLAMPQPFASGEGAELTPILAPSGATGSKVNYADGFPSVYSAPSSNNGKFVTRGQMNAIGNLASQNQFYFLAGGINTFDATFCASIGGYPEGAVLKYLNNGYLYDVISLIDNNAVDFTAQGVDGVNWAYLSVEEKKVFDDVFFEGGSGVSTGTSLLGIVKAKRSGGLAVESSITPTVGSITFDYSFGSSNTFRTAYGCGIMILPMGTSISQDIQMPYVQMTGTVSVTFTPIWNGWQSLAGGFGLLAGGGSNLFFWLQGGQDADIFGEVEKDNYYAVALMCGEGEYGSSTAGSTTLRMYKYESLSGIVKIAYSS